MPAAPVGSSRWLAVLVVAALWGLITHGTSAGTGDEPHYEMIAHSVVFDRDLDLTFDYANPDNLALGGRFEGGAHVLAGKDGRLRPVHDVGMPLLFAPYYLVAYEVTAQIVARVPASWLTRARLNFNVLVRHFLSLAMIGVTAAIAVRLLAVFSTLSPRRGRAFVWTLLLALSPPILSHSFLFFTEIVSAFLGLVLFMWLYGTRQRQPDRLEALFAGAGIGLLFLVHARNAGLVAGLIGLALAYSSRWGDRRPLMPFFAGAAALLAVRTAITYHFWGTWLTTPHERLGELAGLQPILAESATRVVGWLFDQEHGLLPYAPIYALVPAGFVSLWKRDRELCAALSLVVLAYVGVMTLPFLNVHGWRGGWSPAARFLVPVAPFLAVFAFAAIAGAERLPVVVVGLAMAQAALDAVLWQHPGLLWNDGVGSSALLTYLDGGSGRLTALVPSIIPPVTPRTLMLIAGATTLWLALTGWLTRSSAVNDLDAVQKAYLKPR
jgi:hypothetical protein